MKHETIIIEKLASKGVPMGYQAFDEQAWGEVAEAVPEVPKTIEDLRKAAAVLFDRKAEAPAPDQNGIVMVAGAPMDACGTPAYSNFFLGLGNPDLDCNDVNAIIDDIVNNAPNLEQSMETEHFVLRWTNQSEDPNDNIDNPALMQEAGELLEFAWTRLTEAFDERPFPGTEMTPDGFAQTKIRVAFYDMPCSFEGLAGPPIGGPIIYDAPTWVEEAYKRPGLAAHELFHKIQAGFGYQTQWWPFFNAPYRLFHEGTAVWAELFTWGNLSMTSRLTTTFSNTRESLLTLDYESLPFWIFFEARNKTRPDENPIAELFRRGREIRKILPTIKESIRRAWPEDSVYGSLHSFFALWARERLTGRWRETREGVDLYPEILYSRHMTPIRPELTVDDVELRFDRANVHGDVAPLASRYFRIDLPGNNEGRNVRVRIEGEEGGDFTFDLLWERNEKIEPADPAFHESLHLDRTERIRRGARALYVIVSGRYRGGAFDLSATVSNP